MNRTEEYQQKLQEYKDKVKRMRDLMHEYNLTHNQFLEEMYPDNKDYNIWHHFKNFLHGRAYKHAYDPPYKFMLRLEIFIDNHIN